MNERKKALLVNTPQDQLRRFGRTMRMPLTAIFFGLLVGGIVIQISGKHGAEAIGQLILGGYGTGYAITTTLTRATPIIFAGLASALAWGSGYETMGIAGQMTLSAFTTAVVAASLPFSPWLSSLVAVLCGMAVAMAYSMLSAWISARFETSLLIVSLMLNYIAENIASYFTNYVFKDPFASDNLAIQTQKLEAGVLPRLLPKYTVHAGFLIAIFCVLTILFMKKRTSFGYESSMNGLNPRFARYGGIKSKKTMYMMLLLSGAIAGLGGAVEVLGTRYRFIDKMITSPGYAWNGITASLMSSNHPIGIFFSSIFLAGLTTGGAAIERSMRVPQEITSIIQGVLTIFVTARFFVKKGDGKGLLSRFRKEKKEVKES